MGFLKYIFGISNKEEVIKDSPNVNIDEVADVLGIDRYIPILSDKKYKRYMSIGLFVTVVSLVVAMVCADYIASIPKEVEFASGMLSDSIFESQNTYGGTDEEFTTVVSLEKSPYTIEVAGDVSARVDNGHVQKIEDGCISFITEYSDDADLSSMLMAQLGKSYMIDVDETMCTLTPYKEEEGYINGFAAVYRASLLRISNGTEIHNIYVEGYDIKLMDCNVFVAVSALGTPSTELFENIRDIAARSVYTLSYSEELAKKMEEAEKLADGEIGDVEETTSAITEETTKSNLLNNGNTIVLKGEDETIDSDTTKAADRTVYSGYSDDINDTEVMEDIVENNTDAEKVEDSTQSEDSKKESLMIPVMENKINSVVKLQYSNQNAYITSAVVTTLEGKIIAEMEEILGNEIIFEAADYEKGSYLIVVESDMGIGDSNAKISQD